MTTAVATAVFTRAIGKERAEVEEHFKERI
jgi:hypothetical protein